MGFVLPFLNIFYVRVGLNGTEIGWTTALGALVSLVAAPVWMSQSERWDNPRTLLQLSLALIALCFLWLAQQTVLPWILLITALRALVGAGFGPMSDALALSVTNGTRHGFGSVRVWASLGWAIVVLFSGWLIERTGLFSAFIGVALALATGAALLFAVRREHFGRGRGQSGPSLALGETLGNVWRNPAMRGIAAAIVMTGLANSGVGQFEMVYLEALGAGGTLLGIAGMLSAVVELPCMLWADRLVRRYGARRVLLLGLWIFAALRGIVFLAPAIGTILAERALGGVAFSFYTVALIQFIVAEAPAGQTRTVLALFNVTLASLIGILGAPVAGAAYDLIGVRWLFAVAALGYVLGGLALQRRGAAT